MRLFNRTDGPLAADFNGRVLPGGEWDDVDDELADGYLRAGVAGKEVAPATAEQAEPQTGPQELPAAQPPVTGDTSDEGSGS